MHVHGVTHGPRLVASLAITLAFVVGEAIAGFSANSLALMSDAAHNASDALALGLAAYAIWISKRPANEKKTYGYHRANILIALFNAVSLVVIGVVILVEAWELFRKPEPVVGSLMIWVAGISVLMNTVIATLLSGGAKDSLNVRAAYLHMAGDAISAVGVVVAGFVIKSTGWIYADPLVSALIAVFILFTAWGIVREATNILLEAAPRDLDFDQMITAMRLVEGVCSVHDVHAWTVSDGMNYMSCHVELSDGTTIEDSSRVVRQLNHLLAHDFRIAHATIQTELAGTCAAETGVLPVFCDQSAVRHYHAETPCGQ
jgi:cobalt-zinc-cadmium efflux system protein